MKLFKKYYNINPITLDKEFLLKIESEVFAVWEELENDLLNSFRIDIRTHNQEIDEKGYSYKVFSDSKSKTKLSDQDIEDYIYQNKEEVLKKRISYPKESPKISYKDSENEYEVSSINDLFSLNLKDRFEFLKISVRGRDSKSIDISFSSRYMGASSDNTIAVSSLDDAWVLGTLEKVRYHRQAGGLMSVVPPSGINSAPRLYRIMIMRVLKTDLLPFPHPPVLEYTA